MSAITFLEHFNHSHRSFQGYFCGLKLQNDASRRDLLIKRKVIAFIDEKKNGQELANLDLKLMPRVLSIIEKNCSFPTFHKVMMTWNFPQLFSNPHPERVIRDLRAKLEVLERKLQMERKENEGLKRCVCEKEQEIEMLQKRKKL